MALTQTIQILLPEFQGFLVLISRIGGLLAALPVLSGRAVPAKVKVALVLALGVLLAPLVPLPAVPYDPVVLAAGLVSEMVIGLAIGLAVRLFFGALELAGELIGVQMGFGVVQLFDPATAEQTPIIGQYFTLLATLIFLSLNGHLLLVATILSSYESIPAFGASRPRRHGRGYPPPLSEHVHRGIEVGGARARHHSPDQYSSCVAWDGRSVRSTCLF